MLARSLRKLVGAVAASSMLAGCANYSNPPIVPEGPLPPPPVYRKNPILQFCEDHEWVCIVGGIAVLGGAIAIIKGVGADADSD